MAQFNEGDPRKIGWDYPPTRLRPFSYGGHSFPQGVDERVAPLFTVLLDRLTSLPGFRLHSGSGLDDGDWGAQDRNVRGGSNLSFHAAAVAIDVNAPWNPLGVANPPASPYRVPDVADQIALDLGILWGGNHRFTRKDRMHFEVHKTPAEVAGDQVPALPPPAFPLAAGWAYGMAGRGAKVVSGSWNPGPYTAAIQMIQRVVRASPDGVYGPRTDAAVRTGQALHRIVVDGLVGPITWRKLFP
jgi:peptidoglycan hydrolase-like protein with peptidoglycan-binding domain